MTEALTKDQIFAARRDRKPVRLTVPDWGGDVFVRVLKYDDQMRISEEGAGSDAEFPLRLIIAAVVDEDGAPIFEDGDLDRLMAEDFPVIMAVFREAGKVNGITSKELDEAVRDFERTPDAAGSSA